MLLPVKTPCVRLLPKNVLCDLAHEDLALPMVVFLWVCQPVIRGFHKGLSEGFAQIAKLRRGHHFIFIQVLRLEPFRKFFPGTSLFRQVFGWFDVQVWTQTVQLIVESPWVVLKETVGASIVRHMARIFVTTDRALSQKDSN